MHQRIFIVILVGLLIGLAGALPVQAQAPVAGEGPTPAKLSEKQLEDLVGRIALYPDDLLAIVLPASTFPLDIVQADRFLQKLKKDPKLQPDSRWDQSVRSLLNYPEVVSTMSRDLDWTKDLGEAVVSQQVDVMKAIQVFRAKASNAGNLKTDDKQIIVKEKETIKIVQANPEVIYVPQYQPSTVVVYQSAPVYAYYPTAYPVYYYPYAPGAAFATGVFFGAATAWACNWNNSHVEHNVNVNRTDNLNINRNNPQYQQRADQARQQAQQRADQARGQGQQRVDQTRAQGQQRADQARSQAQQRGDQARQQGGAQGGGSQWQSQKRPGEVGGGRPSTQPVGSRPGYGDAGASRGDAGASRGDTFGNAGRGSEATRDSSRGMQSRGSSGSSPASSGVGSNRGSGSSPASSGGFSRGGSGGSSPSGGGSRGSGGGFSSGGGSRGGGGGGGRGGGGGGRR